jgi:aconitase A
VILEAKDFEQWEKGDAKDAAALMKPADNDVLQRWPVSKRVNSSKAPTDDASLIAIEGSVATPDEIMAATMTYARELGQFTCRQRIRFISLFRSTTAKASHSGD